jgi:subtilase family serine protease
MRRLIPAFILLVGIAMSASTASAQAVQLSGRTFHKEACVGPSAPGTARCHAHLVTDRAGNILHDLARGGRPMATRNATPSGYGPSDLQSAYNVAIASAANGAGITIAIVDAYGYPNAEHDLGIYRIQYGLSACTTANGCFKKVNQTGGTRYPKNNTGWAQEQSLDVDMVSAMCPNCHILLVEANTANYSDLAAAENEAAALGAFAISNSYGGGESGSQSYEYAYNHPNAAITVSTGDSGYGVQFPASSPHVTAVGGTSLAHAANARGWSETVWSGSGSGCSTAYGKQNWQAFITLCGNRMEADTSAVADPNTGVAAYGPIFGNFSGWLVFGGTSVASPLTAAIYGLNGHLSGPQNQMPYLNTSSLNDVISGSNGSCGGTYLCTGASGYDGPTGLGTPNGTGAF